jgi:hypothetical protein
LFHSVSYFTFTFRIELYQVLYNKVFTLYNLLQRSYRSSDFVENVKKQEEDKEKNEALLDAKK